MASGAEARKTTLITGCSQGGIGHSLAQTLSSPPYNHHVIATARDTSSLSTLSSQPNITVLALDVTSTASIASLRDTVSSLTGGKLHYLINNAGRNYTVPAVEVDMDEVRQTFQTNLFGVIELCNTFTPLLIAAADSLPPPSSLAPLGTGLSTLLRLTTLGLLDGSSLGLLGSDRPAIIQIGSIAGVCPYVFGSVYNASKAALHSYSDTLRLELRPFGVDVCVIVTGGVKSRIARTERALRPGSLYTAMDKEYQRRLKHSQEVGMPNEEYARRVCAAVARGGRQDRVWEGAMAKVVKFITEWLPRGVLEAYMWRAFGLWKVGKERAARLGKGKQS